MTAAPAARAPRLAVPGRLRACAASAPWVALAVGLTACSAPVQVRSLATGRPDVAAYQLTGPNARELRQQVMALCPQGAEVLHAAEQGQVITTRDAGWLPHWQSVAERLSQPQPAVAQMLVQCDPSPQRLAVRPDPARDDAAAGQALAKGKPGWLARMRTAWAVVNGKPPADAPASGYDK